MQFGSRVNPAVLDVTEHDHAFAKAACGIFDQELIVDDAVKAIATAPRIEPHQMVLQQLLLPLRQHADHSAATDRCNIQLLHSSNSSWWPSRRRRIPSPVYMVHRNRIFNSHQPIEK